MRLKNFGKELAVPGLLLPLQLSALAVQVFYDIQSERQLMEQLDYNLLYRWFVGLRPTTRGPTTFKTTTGCRLLSDEHFSVDGTLIEAWSPRREFPYRGRQRRG
jgi:transposase